MSKFAPHRYWCSNSLNLMRSSLLFFPITGEVFLFQLSYRIAHAKIQSGINNPPATSGTVCQKCLGKGTLVSGICRYFPLTMKPGHFTYECKSSRPYVSRPSRTEQLEKPNVLAKLKKDGKPSLELPDEFKTKYVIVYNVNTCLLRCLDQDGNG